MASYPRIMGGVSGLAFARFVD
ncbi:uncharacterized protein G2W53_030957 [Senna tora]|uniref:Uncharacterized protein n=1 Tax=Senna tora TaxID=362788 RepID=A0A834T840_9FABA|nr:uncharacterized protein G2W53_030957 [Senna tora]